MSSPTDPSLNDPFPTSFFPIDPSPTDPPPQDPDADTPPPIPTPPRYRPGSPLNDLFEHQPLDYTPPAHFLGDVVSNRSLVQAMELVRRKEQLNRDPRDTTEKEREIDEQLEALRKRYQDELASGGAAGNSGTVSRRGEETRRSTRLAAPMGPAAAQDIGTSGLGFIRKRVRERLRANEKERQRKEKEEEEEETAKGWKEAMEKRGNTDKEKERERGKEEDQRKDSYQDPLDPPTAPTPRLRLILQPPSNPSPPSSSKAVPNPRTASQLMPPPPLPPKAIPRRQPQPQPQPPLQFQPPATPQTWTPSTKPSTPSTPGTPAPTHRRRTRNTAAAASSNSEDKFSEKEAEQLLGPLVDKPLGHLAIGELELITAMYPAWHQKHQDAAGHLERKRLER